MSLSHMLTRTRKHHLCSLSVVFRKNLPRAQEAFGKRIVWPGPSSEAYAYPPARL
jgi:hypothetical protein